MPKYPNVKVNLIGKDGNAFSILSHCQREARRKKVPEEELKKFVEEAKSGDYDHLLRTCIEWFNIE